MRIRLLLSLLLLASLALFAEEVTLNEITYSIDYTTATATVTLSEPTNGDIVIPATITVEDIEYPVVGIDNYAFSYCSTITSIIVPEGVTFIGHWAFNYCIKLTAVTLPAGITSIGNHAFYKCDLLEAIDIPEEVESIGNEVFYKCLSLRELTLPESLTTLGDYAIAGCPYITSMFVPERLASIGEGAFTSCSSLVAIEVSANNAAYCSVDGVLFSKDMTTLIAYPIGREEDSYQIPATTTTVGDYAFYDAPNLCMLDLPKGVTKLGDYALYNCANLTTLTLPDEGLTTLGCYALSLCTSLEQVELPEGLITLAGYLFEGCESLLHITLPETLSTIDEYAFSCCTALSTIYLPAAVDSIADYAFDGCTALENFQVDPLNSNYSIIDGVLFYADGVSLYVYPAGNKTISYTIPATTTVISGCAFAYCPYLETVVLSDSLTEISPYSFFYCENLAHVYNRQVDPLAITTNTFFKLADVATLYVPTGSVSAYEVAKGWNAFDYIVEEEIASTNLCDVEEQPRLATTQRALHITGVDAGAPISIYTGDGMPHYRGMTYEGVTTIPLSPGLYIVQVGNKRAARVVVR